MQERPTINKMAQCMSTHPTSSIYIYSKHGKTPSEMNHATYLSGHKSHLNPALVGIQPNVPSLSWFMVKSAGAAPDTPSPTARLSSHPYISSRTPL